MYLAPTLTSIIEDAAPTFTWNSEDQLQQQIHAALTAAGVAADREVRLSSTARIDLLAGATGIEVKIAGSWKDVTRQLGRYAASDRIQHLILVTTKADHRRVPRTIGTVTVSLVLLLEAAL